MFDWISIKAEYITTHTSYRKLAAKYSVSFTALKSRAGKEGWVQLRDEYQKNVYTKATQYMADKQADLLSKELLLTEKISAVLEAALNDTLQFNRYIIIDSDPNGHKDLQEKIFVKIDMQALKEAAQTLQIVEKLKRRLANIPTEKERQKLEIEHERLAIVKARYSAQDWDEGSTGVVILADIKTDEE